MSWQTPMQVRWQAASRREQRSLSLAATVAALALLWWLAVAPALAVWRTAPAQQLALETQLQHMQTLQTQARALQALPTLNAAEARSALEESLKPLGAAAQMSVQVERVTVSLKAVDAQALAQCLSASRQNARLVPTEAHLSRSAAGAGADGATWNGSVVFNLPAQ